MRNANYSDNYIKNKNVNINHKLWLYQRCQVRIQLEKNNMHGKFWFMVLFISCRLSFANSSNTRCYSSTDGEMENDGFCTTRMYCHNASLVPSNPGECKNGEKCCIPHTLRRKRRGGLSGGSFY